MSFAVVKKVPSLACLVLSLIFTTVLVIVIILLWCPNLGTWFSSPVTYLFFMSYLVLHSALMYFQLFSKDTTLRCIKEYCRPDRAKAMPHLILVMSLVMIYCLNILLLCTYVYSQRRNHIEVDLISFIRKLVCVFTQHFWVTMVCLPCYLGAILYWLGLISSFIFDKIFQYELDQIPGALVVCAMITWFLCSAALLLCYSLLPSHAWVWQEVGLIVFPLLCCVGILISLTLAYSKSLSCPLPKFPSWLLYLTCVTVVITSIAIVLVQIPVVPNKVGRDRHISPTPTVTIAPSNGHMPAVLPDTSSHVPVNSKPSTRRESAAIDEDIQPS